MPSNGSYNAMYNPTLEEYLLTNPADVLPEFLVQVGLRLWARLRAAPKTSADVLVPPSAGTHAARAWPSQYKYVRSAAPRSAPSGSKQPGSCIISTDLTVATAPDNATVGVPRAEHIAASSDVPRPASVGELLSSISAPLVPSDGGRPLSSRSRARLVGCVRLGGGGGVDDGPSPLPVWARRSSTTDELSLPWQQVRANAARQREASISTVHNAFESVWSRLRRACAAVRHGAT